MHRNVVAGGQNPRITIAHSCLSLIKRYATVKAMLDMTKASTIAGALGTLSELTFSATIQGNRPKIAAIAAIG